jgi:phosphate-selective porin OprO and OprP
MRIHLAAAAAVLSAVPLAAQTPDAALQARLAAQDAEIAALKAQMQAMATLLGNRVGTVEAATEAGKVVMTAPSPRLESAAGEFSLALVGTLQPQVAFYHQSGQGAGAPALNNGTSFRRAHFGVQGTAFGDFAYTLVFDGAATGGVASAVRDATISYAGLRPITITLGNQKPIAGLEPLFSDRSNAATFQEPGLPAVLATVNGTRAIGARVSAGGEQYSASVGIFGDDLNNAGIANPAAKGWGLHGRATLAPVNRAGRLLHLGASGYWRQPGTGRAVATDPLASQIRYRAVPESNSDTTALVDTGALTRVDHYSYIGLESAGVWGPFSLQGEYAISRVGQLGGRLPLVFHGAYASASWFVTGESRVYEGRTGVFGRTRPRRNFDAGGGSGAFELAARWSTLDLDSRENELAAGGVRGGRLTDYTLAANWYLNAFLRLQANYVHADSDRRSAAGADLGTRADIITLRVQQEW